jgi:hypothetical protein
MPALVAPAFPVKLCDAQAQRSETTATSFELAAAFHEAGRWRGSDIAAAATIVARSTRRVHIAASCSPG